MKLTSRQKDAVYGFIIGDCLGVPYEFSESNNIKKLKMVTGTHNQLPGTWSDDTAMLLATLDTDITDVEKVRANLKTVLTGKYFPDNHMYDIGTATVVALGDRKYDCLQDGNGALMRILPYAFLPDSPKINIETLVSNANWLTHKSKLSETCCYIYVRTIRNALNNYFKIADVHPFGPHSIYLDYQSKNGYVIDSLKLVLKVCKEATSYTDGMIRIINIGGDTDTHCALAGAYLALKFNDWKKWKKEIRNIELVEKVLS